MNILGPACGYTDLLDLAIEEVIKKKDEDRRSGKKVFHPLRPSSAGSCARKLAYDLNEFRGNQVYDVELQLPSLYRLFELGHAIEYQALKTFSLLKVVQQRYKQQTLTFFELETLDPKTKKEVVEGSCDVVFWSEKYKAVADVKSRKDSFSMGFKTRWDEDIDKYASMQSLHRISETAFYADDLVKFIDELGDDYFVDNLYQLNLYASSEFLLSRGIDHGFVYRYNKNDSRHLELRFRPSKEAAERVRKKFNDVNLAIEKKDPLLVPKTFTLGSMRCAFCQYKKVCWGDADALKEWFATFPKKEWPTELHEAEPLHQIIWDFEALEQRAEDLTRLTEAAAKILTQRGITKVKLQNGHVWELKFLKSPKQHFELRRAKS